jgi:hypothetical protein
MKKIFQTSLAALVLGSTTLSFNAAGNQAIVIPNLVTRFNNNAMSITQESPFFRANQFALTHPSSGQNFYFVTPNPGGGVSAFAVPNTFSVPNSAIITPGRRLQGNLDGGDGLIRGFNPPFPQEVVPFAGSPFIAGPFVSGPAGQGLPNVPNTSVPEPPLDAVPGVPTNSVPGPATNAVPLPPGSLPGLTNTFPGGIRPVFPNQPGAPGAPIPGINPGAPGTMTPGTPGTIRPSTPGTVAPRGNGASRGM